MGRDTKSISGMLNMNTQSTAIRDTRIWLPEHASLATSLYEAFGTTNSIILTAWRSRSQPIGPWVTNVKLHPNPRKVLRAEAVFTLGCLALKWAHTRSVPNSSVSIGGGRGTVAPYSPNIYNLSKDWNVVNLMYPKSAEAIPPCNSVSDPQGKEKVQQAKGAGKSERPAVMVVIGPRRVVGGISNAKACKLPAGLLWPRDTERFSESFGR